jgi:hypothetical protein
VTGLQIDTALSLQAARQWTGWADQINATRMKVGDDAGRLWLGTLTAWGESRLASAATELWTVSGFLRLLVEQLEALDAGPVMLHASAIDQLMWLAGGQIGSPAACPAGDYSGVVGEIGETFESELRSPYDMEAADPSELGRQLVMRALQDTATPGQIRKDEFELVRLADGRYLLALPGVVDLTDFGPFHDRDNRSVRDLDQSALRSSLGTSVGGNAYAEMVWDALDEHGVPPGSEVVIVGHSFGADTALDLASDAQFNGPGGFDVTHVVAAGYDSQPQLDDVPDRTHVLVLQNRKDVPVLAETAEHVVTQPLEDVREIVDGVADLDVGGVLGGVFGAVWHPTRSAMAPALHVATHTDDVVTELWHGDVLDAAEDAVLPIADTDQHGDSQVDVVFDGGWSDFGHDQHHYVEYLASTSDPLVLGFLGSLATGTAAVGTAVAVDVSVPERDNSAQKT